MTVAIYILAVIGGLTVAYTAILIWAVWFIGKHNAENRQLREQLSEANRRLAVAVGHPSVRKPAAVFQFPVKNTDPYAS